MSTSQYVNEPTRDLQSYHEAMKEVIEAYQSMDTSTSYDAEGTVEVKFIIFGGKLKAKLRFSTGECLKFEGGFGGVGAGGGGSKGEAMFSVSPSQLLQWKDTAFQFTSGPRGTTVRWYRDGVMIGVFNGTEISGGGESGGKGDWKKC